MFLFFSGAVSEKRPILIVFFLFFRLSSKMELLILKRSFYLEEQ